MNWLLSKKDEERLALHQYLITHHSKTFLIKDLIKAMNLSRYLVLQAVQQLNVDYQAITKSSQTFITIADANRTMTLHNLQLISVGALKGYYLRQSLKFELLLDVFLEDVHSNETIAFRHSSSTTVVRTMKEEVRDQLLLQGINIADNYKLVGDERQIRTMMVEQIYIAFANEKLPFSAATLNYVKQVQHDVIPLLTKRATIKRVLEITIGVWHTRVSNHHHIQPTDENQEKVDWAIQRIGRAYGHYFMKQLPEEQKQAIKDLMGPALIRLCYFPPYDIQPLPDIDFQMKTYPIHTAFTKQVVHIFTRRFDYDEQQLMSILFNPLLNAFIKVFDVREIFPLITVTIDLIDMPALENYLTQMVAQWDTLNLRITNQLTKKTDFYLSNVMISEKIPGFAWQSIPEWSEQLALRQQMIDLTTHRFYKW
ncbi:helix-turn-helix domain-containing protein [Weissella paramesenteroides]|uniref:helix-turn-helix domain-containing protein n=1 Tax=Weissella paramesenteroides TaxID=1249 RepID=UPI0023F6F619|nr:helix-turn-helix domain-containing protein [Weissella paramesenteroides]MDF8372253.1 hypothetical protein [Weissella paramesenteroides]WIG66040.1 hypothetical protein G9U56_03410 [Weissella paramesenteroides]